MSHETRVLNARKSDGDVIAVTVSIASTPPWRLSLDGLGDTRTFEGDDLSHALTALRGELEAHGLQLLCMGARPDVAPSGMSRSMGSGRQAYILPPGRPAETRVDIFDPAPAADVGSIAEQRAYRQRWADELRSLSQ